MNLSEILAKYKRVAITGGPKTGKTTHLAAAITDRTVYHADDFKKRAWDSQPDLIREQCQGEIWAVEGVQVARALRRGLEVDCVILCTTPLASRTKAHKTMAKSVRTVLRDWRRTKNREIPLFNQEDIDMPKPANTESVYRRYELGPIDFPSRTADFVASTDNPGLTYDWNEETKESEEVWQRIVGWDLERFAKNGRFFWQHRTTDTPVGWAQDVVFDEPSNELRMRCKFALESEAEAYGDFPGAERVWRAVACELMKAVSVGFRIKSKGKRYEQDGKIFEDVVAELTEVSIVGVGEDEDALTQSISRAHIDPDGNVSSDDEDARQTLAASKAGQTLAAARKRKAGLRTMHFDSFELSLRGRLKGKSFARTPVGGLVIPATLGRVGVVRYGSRALGGERSELRPKEEVSDIESLKSFEGAPIIDFWDHTKLIDITDFKGKTLGHVRNVRMDGEFVVGELWVDDAEAIEQLDNGERSELSPGYVSADDRTSGSWRGENYDRVQRKIRYNHVALCPPGRGRAGSQVAVRIDATDPDDVECVWQLEGKIMKVIKLDGVEYEEGSPQHLAKIEQLHQAKLDANEVAITKVTAERDTLQAKLDAKAKEDEETKKKLFEEEEKKKALFEEEKKKAKTKKLNTIKTVVKVLRVLEDEEKDGEKLDAKLDALLERDEQELMVEAITKTDPTFKADGKGPEYIQVRFDMIEIKRGTPTDNIVRRLNEVKDEHLDANEDDPDGARERMIRRNRGLPEKKTA